MRTHVAISLRNENFVFRREDSYHYWVNHLEDFCTITKWISSGNSSIEKWLANVPKNGMLYIGSFTDFAVFKQEHPEHFL
ncbi:MAG: hypothetical protein ACYDD5_01000 [Sulfuricurvum sp.]